MTNPQQPSAQTSPTDDSLAATLLAVGVLPANAAGVPQELATQAILDDLALEVTKKTKNLITWGSAGGAGAGIVASFFAWSAEAGDSVIIALVIGTAIVIAAGTHGLARVMDGDVRGRSSVSTATVEARGLIAKSLIEAYATEAKGKGVGSVQTPLGADQPLKVLPEATILSLLAAFNSGVEVRTGDDEYRVKGARWGDAKKLQLRTTTDEWIDADKVTGISGARP